MFQAKMQKIQFDAIKWDLYRAKCEDVEDQYADFKRLQKKINWFISLITRAVITRRLKQNFDDNKERVLLQCRKEYTAHRFQYYFFKVHARRHGANAAARSRQWLRQTLASQSVCLIDQAEATARVKLARFLADKAGRYSLHVECVKFYGIVAAMQCYVRKSLEVRAEKWRRLCEFFESERKIMTNYYLDKDRSRKQKKHTKLIERLRSLDHNSQAKDRLLRTYYHWVLVQQNLMDAIYYVASIRMARGGDLDPATAEG